MAKITNPALRPLRLPTGHVVPALGALITTNEVLRCADNAPMLNGLAVSGQITVEYDAETDLDGVKTPARALEPSPEAQAQAQIDAQLEASRLDDLPPEAPKKK